MHGATVKTFKLLHWRKIFRVEVKKGIYNLTIFQLDATYSVYYITVHHTVGMNTYRMMHMNQFQLNNDSGWQ